MSKLEVHINKDEVMVKLGRKWIALWEKRIVIMEHGGKRLVRSHVVQIASVKNERSTCISKSNVQMDNNVLIFFVSHNILLRLVKT